MNVFDRIPVAASTPYEVTVGRDLLTQSGAWLRALHAPCTVCVTRDDTVDALYADTVTSSLTAAGFRVIPFVFPHGEPSKSIATYGRLLEFLAEQALDRHDLLIALGGGVTGDLTGFAAATYLRGVGYVQIPTTFLAAVDSSVGGKTAVNLSAGKNLAGAFKQPLGVLCDCDTFDTLPPDTFANGSAEAIKSAMLADEELFTRFEVEGGLAHDALPAAVARCVRIKGAVVAEDEFDTGRRQLLNFGHTIGHGVERCSRFGIEHGHAVAIGMAIISRATERMGLCEPLADRLCTVLHRNGLPTATDFTPDELLAAALHDKKRSGDKVTLVLPVKIGECRLHPATFDQLREFIVRGSAE